MLEDSDKPRNLYNEYRSDRELITGRSALINKNGNKTKVKNIVEEAKLRRTKNRTAIENYSGDEMNNSLLE